MDQPQTPHSITIHKSIGIWLSVLIAALVIVLIVFAVWLYQKDRAYADLQNKLNALQEQISSMPQKTTVKKNRTTKKIRKETPTPSPTVSPTQ